jgi:hypothetical protein
MSRGHATRIDNRNRIRAAADFDAPMSAVADQERSRDA